MSENGKPTNAGPKVSRLSPILRASAELLVEAILRSVPLIGPALVIDRRTLSRLSTLFESDDEIRKDVDKVVRHMSETEEIMTRLAAQTERRKVDLERTLEEYERFKALAAVERDKARPLLDELRREGNKGIIWGLLINLLMVILGIILAHFLRIWVPGFTF